jgi:hypothetical protein
MGLRGESRVPRQSRYSPDFLDTLSERSHPSGDPLVFVTSARAGGGAVSHSQISPLKNRSDTNDPLCYRLVVAENLHSPGPMR